MSVGSGIDADRTEKSMECYRINGVAQRRLRAYATMAMGVLWV